MVSNYLELFSSLETLLFSLVLDLQLFFHVWAHLDSLEVLTFVLNQGSLIFVFLGESGIGKTQVILTRLFHLNQEIKLILIFKSCFSTYSFSKTLFKALSLKKISDLSATKAMNMDLLLKKLRNFSTAKKEAPLRGLLVIDESKLFPLETLEELRLPTNLKEGKDFFLLIVLVGQPNFAEKIKYHQLSHLRQKISVWDKINPLESKKIVSYLWFRIKQVAEIPNIDFEKSIEKPLYKWPKGITRLINKIMDRTLFIAYDRGKSNLKRGSLKDAQKTLASFSLKLRLSYV